MSKIEFLSFLTIACVTFAAQAPHRAAINALGVLSQEVDEVEPLALLQVSDPLTAPLEAFMEVSAERLEVMRLEDQLEASTSATAALESEHKSLLQELQGWRASGARVLERENSLLEHVRHVSPPAIAPAGGRTAILLSALPVVLLVALLLTAGIALATRNAAASKSMAASTGRGAAQVTKPILQRLGVGAYTVDISELQVYMPGAPASSEVCVKLRLGESGKGLRSKPGESVAESPALSIQGGFHVTVKASDGPCVLSVVDRNKSSGSGIESLGRLELSAGELVRMARRVNGQEFFRFELSCPHNQLLPMENAGHELPPVASMSATDSSTERAIQPYVAMRIRDITGRSEVVSATGVRKGSVFMYGC